jgi:6-pyruvoyl-tetrahydropterin synthase
MQLFVNDLTVMDFSYLCPERGIVGESWIVDVELDGNLNEESMIQDFAIVKKQLKSLIDQYVDHKLLIPVEHQFTNIVRELPDELVRVDFERPEQRSIHLTCPADAYAFIYAETITMTSVGDYLQDILAIHLPNNVAGIKLSLRTELIPSAFYHYTHGLKKHDGNCQRIAHGHRSKIHIYHNGHNQPEAEAYWAMRWSDIYLGTREDEVACDQLSQYYPLISEHTHVAFRYTASQGDFELAVPRTECEVIELDTTVECLALFVLAEEQIRTGNSNVTVIAFEGVGKGAKITASS